MPKLKKILVIEGTIETRTGLHIGAGNTEMHIGGTDNPVIRNPLDDMPYIPGSSLKGKIRSLLEWYFGKAKETPLNYADLSQDPQDPIRLILTLFGGTANAGKPDEVEKAKEIMPARLAFWDCPLNAEWAKNIKSRNLLFTENKTENSINRITGTAENPRQTERVPAGAKFDFRLTVKFLDNDDEDKLTEILLKGIRLLEMDNLGGSGSRGYGKISFTFKDTTLNEKINNINLF